MKSLNMISAIALIFISSIYANDGIYNQIENDHRIRNFAFIGPFPKTFNGDSLISIINSDQFSMDNNVKYKGKNYKWIKSHPANGSLAFHNLWHLYPDIQPGDIVIGYAIVNSIKKQKIISEIMNFWYCQADIYINSKGYTPMTYKEFKEKYPIESRYIWMRYKKAEYSSNLIQK